MAAVATLKWSGRVKGQSGANNVYSADAIKLWDVVGASSEDDAMSASGVAGLNDSYDNSNNSAILCQRVEARQLGFNYYEVAARYLTPPNGAFVGQFTVPLDYPTIIDFRSTPIEIPFDRDIAGNPCINANGDPLDPPATRTIVMHTLSLTKNFSFYNYATFQAYENTVNSDSIFFVQPNNQTVTFAAQTIKCTTIAPATSYTKTATFVPVSANFEIYTIIDTNDHPHQWRALHCGKNGYYTDPVSSTKKIGKFAYDRGHEVSVDVRLASNGTPYDSTLKVTTGDSLIAPVATALTNPPAGATFSNQGSGINGATFITYQRYSAVAMSPLFSLFA